MLAAVADRAADRVEVKAADRVEVKAAAVTKAVESLAAELLILFC
jgi:hypothetical protein